LEITLNKKFEFLAGEIPPSIKFSRGHFLYNMTEYINTWPELKTYSFYIYHKEKDHIIGYIRFKIQKNIAFSPFKAPFGSFTIIPGLNFEVFHAFLEFIIKYLKDAGICRIVIKHFPRFYDPGTSESIITSLGLFGFHINTVDINHFIDVSSSPFSSRIHHMEVRKLNKCRKSGMLINVYQNTEVEKLFRYIESFRKARKIPVNIDLSTLKVLSDRFPENYTLYSVSMNKEIIAATVIVKVNDQVLYNFLPSHNDTYNNYSPMVFLMEGIYTNAALHQYKYIDLGVSSIDGIAQPGLIKFKERLGASSNGKFTFIKEIQ
jgi:hypothetical protein